MYQCFPLWLSLFAFCLINLCLPQGLFGFYLWFLSSTYKVLTPSLYLLKSCKTQPSVTFCVLQQPSLISVLSTRLGVFLLARRALCSSSVTTLDTLCQNLHLSISGGLGSCSRARTRAYNSSMVAWLERHPQKVEVSTWKPFMPVYFSLFFLQYLPVFLNPCPLCWV